MYNIFMPQMTKSLNALDAILVKTQEHCAEKNINESRLVNAFLAPDMFDFKKQVQTTCDFAARAAARLAGSDMPSFEDNETTLAELRERIKSTLEYMAGYDAADFNDAATRAIKLKLPMGEMDMTGEQFLTFFALPNFYFHNTSAYNILRQNGIELGKMDFIGR